MELSKQIHKNTPVLRFPEFQNDVEWEVKRLGDVCQLTNGMAFKPSDWKETGIPIVRIQNLNDENAPFNYCTPEIIDDRCMIDNGTLLFSWSGTPGTSFGAFIWNRGKAVLNQHIFIVNPVGIDKVFLKMTIDANMTSIIEKSHGGAGLRHITKSDFEDVRIFVPKDIYEQQRIAAVLSEFDIMLSSTNEKLEQLKAYKKGLIQRLFAGGGKPLIINALRMQCLRFPEFVNEKEWSDINWGDIFIKITNKNKENNQNVLTISAQYGLVSQYDYFNKNVASSDLSNYYLIRKGDFAYNRSRSQGYPFGVIRSLRLYDKGVVSPLYICFRVKVDDYDCDFLEYYFDTDLIDREIGKIAQEGARNHGLLNISTTDFFNNITIPVPSLPEQRKIASCLSTIDDVINSYMEKFILLGRHKKSIIQQMLLIQK